MAKNLCLLNDVSQVALIRAARESVADSLLTEFPLDPVSGPGLSHSNSITGGKELTEPNQAVTQTIRAAQEPHNRPIEKAGPLAGLTVHVKYWDGVATGARRADAIGSQIIVDAGPVDAFARIVETGTFSGKTVTYVLVGTDKANVGHGSSKTRLPYQVGKCGVGSTFSARDVYVLHARDPRIAETVAQFLEAFLIERGFALGVRLTNKVAAIAPEVGDDHLVDFARLAEEARLLLHAAGCTIFENSRIVSSHDDEEDGLPLRDGYCIIAADAFTPQDDAQLLRLDRSNLVCEGYRLGDHLIVRPGSHFKIKKGNGGLRPANVRRRKAILGRNILAADPERSDRKHLTTWVKFETPEIAARVLSGCHSTVTNWVPVEPDAGSVDDHSQTGTDHGRP